MSNKNEVFEYLIDQLRQQLPVVDVMGEIKRWSIDRSIAGRGNYTDEENAVTDAYIGLEHSPYKQQCEDLEHEVQSLKNQLARYKKPYIAYVKKTDWVQGDSRFLKKWGKHRADILRECIQEQDAEIQSLKNQLRDASEQIKELHKALAQATGDVEAYKLIREHEQSGCRKEDAQGCAHNWIIAPGLFIAEGHKDNVPGSRFCAKCGKREWDNKEYKPKNDTQECRHDFEYIYPESGVHRHCIKCGWITE